MQMPAAYAQGAGEGLKITNISATNLLLPVPQSEIDLNKDVVLSQNTGY
jgi:hypothetical protein